MNGDIMKHTKGKWKIDGGTNKKGDLFIWKTGEYYGGHAIATIHGEIEEGAEANAEHIVRCVNSHDALLEACKEMVKCDGTQCGVCDLDCPSGGNIPIQHIKQALAQAEKQT